ncbi:YggT family protein [Brachybacterium sp. EF45031]|uniref:YggT family protein n=1 Tax=Brachybacterium sillae TaxID=2810536 RepID=UPI00217EEE0B|nr:YggT family protein [Brachybacterium sillae]MCS6712409.1 YggT family protein [Brachybacterium sillae]
MSVIAGILYLALFLLQILLIARLIVDWVRALSRDPRPQGIVAVIFELVYTVTDPLVRAVRRVVPPVRLGAVALDLSLLVLLLICSLLMRLIAPLL